MTAHTSHTPGPWIVHHETMIGHENVGGIWAVADVGRLPHDGQRFRPEFERHWEADARLIAAAPALLKALEMFVLYEEEAEARPTSEELEQARAAIALARGGPYPTN